MLHQMNCSLKKVLSMKVVNKMVENMMVASMKVASTWVWVSNNWQRSVA